MATFRRRGERWQAIIRRVDLRATKSFDRLIDAKTWARAREREADLGDALPGKMVGTLAQLIERYEREMWPVKRWGTSKTQELKMLSLGLGIRPLEQISRAVVLSYVRGLNITGGQISSRLSYLREVVRTARDLWGLRVPLEEVEAAIRTARRLKIAGSSIARTRRPTQAEIDAIIAYAESDRPGAIIDLGDVVRVLSVLPLRLGELVGIGWGDLDADRRTVVIRSRKHPDIRVREQNDQEVPLIAFGGVDTFALVSGRPRYLPAPFPYKTNSVSSAFGLAALRCQIRDLHLHDLRAYSLSRLLEAGVPIPQVALISGHRNWKVLAKNYARLDAASVHDTLRRLS